MKDKHDAILREAYEDSSEDDLRTVEGIDSATGKPFVADFLDLKNKKESIREATDRSNQ